VGASLANCVGQVIQRRCVRFFPLARVLQTVATVDSHRRSTIPPRASNWQPGGSCDHTEERSGGVALFAFLQKQVRFLKSLTAKPCVCLGGTSGRHKQRLTGQLLAMGRPATNADHSITGALMGVGGLFDSSTFGKWMKSELLGLWSAHTATLILPLLWKNKSCARKDLPQYRNVDVYNSQAKRPRSPVGLTPSDAVTRNELRTSQSH